MKKGEANTTYIVAQKEIDQVSRVFQWVRGEKISQISFGFGADYSIQKSPDGENLVRMVKGADDKFGYFVTNIKSKQSFALTSIKSKKMTGFGAQILKILFLLLVNLVLKIAGRLRSIKFVFLSY